MWADREAEAHARSASGDPLERRAVNASSAWFLLDAAAIAAGARSIIPAGRGTGEILPMAHPDPRQRVSHLQALRQPRAQQRRPRSRRFPRAPLAERRSEVRWRSTTRASRYPSLGSPPRPSPSPMRWGADVILVILEIVGTVPSPPHEPARISVSRGSPEKFLQRAARQHTRREIQLFSSESIS